MSRFHGAQVKGALKTLREVKRIEAEERNAKTPEKRRRAYRRQRDERYAEAAR